MTLTDGYHEIPDGRLAAVVTCLEMTEAPESPRLKEPQLGGIRLVEKPDLAWYRDLFRAVGRDWLWWSRLTMGDQDLAEVIRDPRVEIFVLEEEGAARGLLELDGRSWPDVELAFFGVVPERVGSGAGAALMAFALDRVWSRGAKRFWLHTCSLDHPRALGFYRKWGFRPYARRIEIAPDPRLTGVLPREAAPQIPLIEPKPDR
jgi:GNAT superfamily N-acetyltransferase